MGEHQANLHQANLNPGDITRILFVLRRKPAKIIKEIGIGLMLFVSAIEVSISGRKEDKAVVEATKVLQIARAQYKAAARHRTKLRTLPSLYDKLSGWAARKAGRVPQTVELLASHGKIAEDDSQLVRANLPSSDKAQAAHKALPGAGNILSYLHRALEGRLIDAGASSTEADSVVGPEPQLDTDVSVDTDKPPGDAGDDSYDIDNPDRGAGIGDGEGSKAIPDGDGDYAAVDAADAADAKAGVDEKSPSRDLDEHHEITQGDSEIDTRALPTPMPRTGQGDEERRRLDHAKEDASSPDAFRTFLDHLRAWLSAVQKPFVCCMGGFQGEEAPYE